MKNNTKLIMENWRKFLKEGPDDESSYYSPASEEPPEGFQNDDYNEGGFNPDDESSYYSPASEEPSEGFQHDDYNEGGFNPDDSGIKSFEPDVDDLGPEGAEAMVPPSDEDLEGELDFDEDESFDD